MPRTRARIFSNTFSRDLEVSSLKGENPRSFSRSELLYENISCGLECLVANFLERPYSWIDRSNHTDEVGMIIVANVPSRPCSSLFA